MTRRLLRHIDIDRSVGTNLVYKGWSLVAGLGTLYCATRFLSAEALGYYYTFASILAIQSLFELGLTYTITQFVSHEMALLRWQPGRLLEGEVPALDRLSSIVTGALKWFIGAAVLFLPFAFSIGVVVFGSNDHNIQWMVPWAIVVSSCSLKIIITACEGIFEGMGQVPVVALVRLASSIAAYLALWVGLASGIGLYASALFSIIGILVASLFYYRRFARVLHQLLFPATQVRHRISWAKDIWPFQWRLSVAWASGFFIYQLFNPVLFYFEGPLTAGRFGVALSIAGAATSVCSAWTYARAPAVAGLYGRGLILESQILYRQMVRSSITASIALGIIAICLWLALHSFQNSISAKLPPIETLTMLLSGVVVNQYVSVVAIFVRAQKLEPYVWSALSCAAFCVVMLLSTTGYGITGAAAAYLTPSLFIALPYTIYVRRRHLHFHSMHDATSR